MANKRDVISDDIRTEIRLLVEQGVTVRTIARKFKIGTSSVTRICREKPEKTALVNVPKCTIKDRKNGGDVINPSEEIVGNKTDLNAYQHSIAQLSLQKAKAVIKSIDFQNIPEGQKAMTAGILIDKARLITGQSTNITEHRGPQEAALKLLDQRAKAQKVGQQPIIIDVKSSMAPEKPHESSPAVNERPADVPNAETETPNIRKE